MKALVLPVVLWLGSGCVVTRELVLPPPAATLHAPEVTALWNVSEVFVRANTSGSADGDNRDYEKLKGQFEALLRQTLEAKAQLVHRLDEAQYGLELVVDVNERSAMSPWLGLGLGLETVTLLGPKTHYAANHTSGTKNSELFIWRTSCHNYNTSDSRLAI